LYGEGIDVLDLVVGDRNVKGSIPPVDAVATLAEIGTDADWKDVSQAGKLGKEPSEVG
jgi:hypothetical protein